MDLCTIRCVESKVTTVATYFSYGTVALSCDDVIWVPISRPSWGLYSWVIGTDGTLRSDWWDYHAYSWWITDSVVSGDRVAWVQHGPSGTQILTVRPGFDSTPTIVAPIGVAGRNPVLALFNNRLAWIDGPVPGDPSTAYVVRTRDMSADASASTLYQSALAMDSIRVSGDGYAWRISSADDGYWHLLGRGLRADTTAHELSDPHPHSDVITPQLSGTHAVWVDSSGHLFSNWHSVAGEEVQVAQDATTPVVSSDRIAWAGTDSSPGCYTLTRGTSSSSVRLSPAGMTVSGVQISGERIMYAGHYSARDPWVLYYAYPNTVPVTPWIDLKPSKRSVAVKRNRTLQLTGVMGDPNGIYLKKPIKLLVSSNYGTTWKTLVTLSTDSRGEVSKKLKLNKRGTFYYRWRAPASDGYTASNSNVLIVHVR
jgi:hypothetical protein